MSNLNAFSFLFLLPFLLGGGKSAEAQSGQKGLLWEINGKGLKKPSYLYGTIHIQSKKVFQYDPVVEEKLKSCNAFAPELILDEINQLEVMGAMMMTDNSLDNLLSPEDYAKLDAFMKASTGTGIEVFKRMKPFALIAQLGQGDVTGEMPIPLDMHLLQIARENKLKTFAVEKLDEQIAVINSIPLADQARMLMEAISDTSSGNKQFEELVQVYLDQNLDAMMSLAEDPSLPKEIQQEFLIARNKVMAERINVFIKEQSTFIAIGAAHLGGRNGIIELLKQQGLKLKAVPFSFKP